MKRALLVTTAGLGLSLGLGVWLWRAPEAAVRRSEPSRAELRLSAPVADPRDVLGTELQRARARASGSALRDRLVALLAEAAQADPARAVAAALALSDAEGRAEALHECLPLWLASDRAAARDFLLSHIASLPLELVQGLVRDTAALDPQLALSLSQQVHISARPRVVREVFAEWAGSAPRAAAEATSRLLESDGQVRVVGDVARIWAEQSPLEAEGWALQLASPALRREALLPIVGSWAARDPKGAAQALSTLPDEGYKQRLVDTVATHWASTSPGEAYRWIAGLTPPALREAGATALSLSLLEREPARAASWALELGGDAHSEIVEKTLTSWSARDPTAALAWAQAQPGEQSRVLLALVHERVRAQGTASPNLQHE